VEAEICAPRAAISVVGVVTDFEVLRIKLRLLIVDVMLRQMDSQVLLDVLAMSQSSR
jgi:hypothetical protein